jgi:FAD/FMN-containing dehydrogenase
MPPTATSLSANLASILAADRVLSDPSELAVYAVDEVTPGVVAKPSNAEQAAEIVKFALCDKLAVIPTGSRSKLGIGNVPARYDIALDLTALDQIAHYDPGDLTLSVEAGCTLRQIGDTLLAQQQFLPLSGAFSFQSTVAGTIASGIDSPLRQFYGTARDFLVGAEFIDGTGAQVKSGGRVVKNVTGYDLHKLLIGSLGTLGIITRLNFRTFPLPAVAPGINVGLFAAPFPDAASAIAFREKIAASPFTPDAVEILSPEFCKFAVERMPDSKLFPVKLPAWFTQENWLVLVNYRGDAQIIQRYDCVLAEFATATAPFASAGLPPAALPRAAGADAFALIRETWPLYVFTADAVPSLRQASPFATIFKIAQLPAKLPALFTSLADIAERAQIPHALFAHGLGIAYFALLPRDFSCHAALGEQTISQLQQAAAKIFAACAAQSATAQIQIAPTPLKRQLNILGPERPDFAAMLRLKSAFDPQNIFAPGRLL